MGNSCSTVSSSVSPQRTMSSLRSFLVAAKERAVSNPTTPLTYVIGNEGGDMDSVVCAIFTALLLTSNTTAPDHIPVLNFGSHDLGLRKDVEGVLKTANVTNSELLFVDQLRFDASKGDRFVLVDHNILKPTQRTLWGDDVGLVTGVIDHHRDEQAYTVDTMLASLASQKATLPTDNTHSNVIPTHTSTPTVVPIRTIEPVGSAASLVALRWKGALLRDAAVVLDPTRTCDLVNFADTLTARFVATRAASVLLAPIVADTSAFKISKGKVTPHDVEAKDFLLRFLQPEELAGFRKSDKKVKKQAASVKGDEMIDDGEEEATKFMSLPTNPAEERLWESFANAVAATSTSAADQGCVFAPNVVSHVKISRFHDWLKELKSDVRGLTVDEQLRRDYKKFTFVPGRIVCGVSTVLLLQSDIDAMYANAPVNEWVEGCKSRMQEEGYNLHLSTLTSGTKELQAVFDPIALPTVQRCLEAFAAATKDHVQLEQTTVQDFPELGLRMIVWKQHNGVVSRKNLTPLLSDHFTAFFEVDCGPAGVAQATSDVKSSI